MFKRQEGFTLIELLVVVAILGVIAAVVVLNVGSFIGTGAVQAANVEFHQVQTAITAYLADDAPVTTFDATIGPASNYPIGALTTEGVHKYLTGPGLLQADYTVVNGAVANATALSTGKWAALHFCNGRWQQGSCV